LALKIDQACFAERVTILRQIVAVHPSGGGDAANFAALNAVIAELA
jgi:hypothetical protein